VNVKLEMFRFRLRYWRDKLGKEMQPRAAERIHRAALARINRGVANARTKTECKRNRCKSTSIQTEFAHDHKIVPARR
jgi:hypothetical protein